MYTTTHFLCYYSILIIHEADKQRLNKHGLDIRPFIEHLIDELKRDSTLIYTKEYRSTLEDIYEAIH